jgi:hypothetical protein
MGIAFDRLYISHRTGFQFTVPNFVTCLHKFVPESGDLSVALGIPGLHRLHANGTLLQQGFR